MLNRQSCSSGDKKKIRFLTSSKDYLEKIIKRKTLKWKYTSSVPPNGTSSIHNHHFQLDLYDYPRLQVHFQTLHNQLVSIDGMCDRSMCSASQRAFSYNEKLFKTAFINLTADA